MLTDGDDAGRCANGLTARKFREATPGERATYRRWIRGMVAFYCVLAVVSGLVAAATYSGNGLTRQTNLSVRAVTT